MSRRRDLISRANNLAPKYLRKLQEQVKLFREESKGEIGFDFEKKLNDVYHYMKTATNENMAIPTDILHGMINDTFRSILLRDIWRMMVINQEHVIAKTLIKEMDLELKQIQQEMEDHVAEL
jgi:hypothetical protein